MTRRGFTIVELIITITIMGILLTLAVVNVNATQVSARDDQRKADVEAIANHLESFYASGASSNGGDVSQITNLFPNPQAATVSRLAFWPGVSGATSNSIRSDGAPFGSTYFRSTWTTSPTSGGGALTVDNAGSFTPGATVTTSFYVRPSINQVFVINIQYYDGATPVGGGNPGQVFTAPANQWTRISSTQTLTGTADDIQVRAYALDPASTLWPVGSTLDFTNVMQTLGSTLYNYGGGALNGWVWNGTPNASTSSGPAVLLNSPGTYPSTSLTSSPLIKVYLPDVDLTSFTAPSQTDPYDTFIPATNAIQTAAGVLPQPTIGQYVYQPIDSNGNVCTTYDCRKFNIYYRLEKDSTIMRVTSKNQ